ncbi:GH36-type glycosyl hydrolase domain-containing protein [Halomonas kalidii]|uniref:Glucoamylase family protein n=1 Tax=Halomonas kalidii TaxID=3043293 RepID=A0ABT6VJA3_9GAMM|nr:glucoamylase family protein [Halomonas kalidii]MDI5934061.1 glucoamylase family protein [Halomonas kalidii]
MQPDATPTDLSIDASARKLADLHHCGPGSSRALASLSGLHAIRDWIPMALAAARESGPEHLAAAEWLLDNHYHARRAVRQVGQDMPGSFYRRLPPLAHTLPGVETGQPRIYALVHGLLQASRLQLSLSLCVDFLQAYQERSPLNIAELWALPTMLRLACLEVLIGAFGRLFPAVSSPLGISAAVPALEVLDDTECIARALSGLMVISTLQWQDVIDRTSVIEATLRCDPADVYPRMDFETRDVYRRAIETLASHGDMSEWGTAEALVARCREVHGDPLLSHVGYWLVDEGRGEFEAQLGLHLPRGHAWRRQLKRSAGPLYAASLGSASAGALGIIALYLWWGGAGAMQLAAGLALALIPASLLGVALVNALVTQWVPPRTLPKLDLRHGIDADCATVIAMPVLVDHVSDVPRLAQQLEGHRLANPDPMLQFALLSDLADADTEVTPGDVAIEAALVAAIENLNTRHGGGDGLGAFHLLHRPRRYNPSEDCWMGWERKRGKLEQFNAFIQRGDLGPYSLTAGALEALRGVRFVVTVDADTRLPPGSVKRLVGTLAHPLNTARFHPETGRVEAGYTILQPRVEITPLEATRSRFARHYAGDASIDIYSRAVSDVYQDLFGVGSFIGKGIYEVEPFTRSLEGRIPENCILSHDLLEGLCGRVGLTSDIVVYESFPADYLEHAARWHRWLRGDWQLLPWLCRQVPGPGGQRLHSRLSTLERWKLLDNLRRSLVPISLVMLALAGWFVLPGSPWSWTALAVLPLGAHLFTDLVTGLARGRRRGAVRGTLRQLREQLGCWALMVTFLLNDAVIAGDAMVRTLWRLSSGRYLLEWRTAAQVAARMGSEDMRHRAWRAMWPATALATLVTLGMVLATPAALAGAAPLLALWVAAPEVAWRLGRRRRAPEDVLPETERAFLRLIARRTWLFFETYVRPEDHWLPPDNYQEAPQVGAAHRTSPTNIGMLMLSSLTAWRLGHVGLPELTERLGNLLDSMDRLERHRGHLLNWHETQRLTPLEPRYVSTVDSGNLAVSLLTLRQACRDAQRGPAFLPEQWNGLDDALQLLAASLGEVDDPGGSLGGCAALVNEIRETIEQESDDPDGWAALLDELRDQRLPRFQACLRDLISRADFTPHESLREVQVWLERTRHHIAVMHRDLQSLMGWRLLAASPPAGCADLACSLSEQLPVHLPLGEVAPAMEEVRRWLAHHGYVCVDPVAGAWVEALDAALSRSATEHARLDQALDDIAQRARAWAHGMDFGFLYDASSRLFFIGYNVSRGRMDANHYDLLASEARLTSYFAIAKGDVPLEHWFHLGRPVTRQSRGLTLVSWSGSMFEYLMPQLLMRSYRDSLMYESERTAVDIQRQHGEDLGIPWGMSESGYAEQDPEQRYRYRAFGVPELGVRRGLSLDRVVAPYATLLALPVRPQAALANLHALVELGALGRYGFFEAVDFTPERVPVGGGFTMVRSYMAHHHGMSLAALGNVLCNDSLMTWFHSDPHVATMELLLSERVPWEAPLERPSDQDAVVPGDRRQESAPALHPWVPTTWGGFGCLHTLGNGRMSGMVTSAAGGSLGWHRHLLTRALGGTGEAGIGGHVLYLQDRHDRYLWSLGDHPFETQGGDPWRVVFHQHQVEFQHREHGIAVSMTVSVAPGDDLEIRYITVVNETDRPRPLSLTSCAEVILAPAADHARHPAFSRLFVGSSYLPELRALLFIRRPLDPAKRSPVLLHRLVCDASEVAILGFETDRRAFLGRHGDARRPAALREGALAGGAGWVLDPVVALQVGLTLGPHQSCSLAFVTIAADSRVAAEETARRYTTLTTLDWALHMADAQAAGDVHRRGLTPGDLPSVQSLLSALLRPEGSGRAAMHGEGESLAGQHDLWALGISGDYPILAVRVGEGHRSSLLTTLLAAHRLWRDGGIRIDLVILYSGLPGYVEPVRDRLIEGFRNAGSQELMGHRGGVHLVSQDSSNPWPAQVIEAVAALILDATGGSLERQLYRQTPIERPLFEPMGEWEWPPLPPVAAPPERFLANGFGGFCPVTGEYVITFQAQDPPPAPWANVLANANLGSIVTEAGLGWSWAENSGENRLTRWHNDPVCDPQAEAIYLRDEITTQIWTPTPLPAGGIGPCRVRHGIGYTIWERNGEGLEQELLAFVAAAEPVKLVRLRLRNPSGQTRRITATYFADWLLGSVAGQADPMLAARYDADTHAILARNTRNAEFADREAFLTSTLAPHSLTTSRSEFLGPGADMRQPDALKRWDLGECRYANGDCCGAFQVHLDIPAGQAAEAVFILGQGVTAGAARELVLRWQDPARSLAEFARLQRVWGDRLGTVQVTTPDPAFDLMVNRWLPYQTLSSRLFARAGFYQASGAFGFRDQLQDVLALLHSAPDLARRHILYAATHQFEEGDVLHWWHPPLGRGVRTRFSDDLLWLPHVTAAYVAATGDAAILSEGAPFLTGPPLGEQEQDHYALFDATADSWPLFDHCERALERAYRLGVNGLPLIGTGDWNDGMDRVGAKGRGQSIWLAWFMISTIRGFLGLCTEARREDLMSHWCGRMTALTEAVEKAGWDGDWYLRALDDDGQPWGAASNQECRIDSIAQSWAVLSAAADPERARAAMHHAAQELMRDDDDLVRLLTPPFDTTLRDPGYIKAYPPGIRENGGQYSHAAAWFGIAFAQLGDGDRAKQVFDRLNPALHARSRDEVRRYLTEPYAVAADIAGVEPHLGRGGWTWYTGASGWSWRLAVEHILGLRLVSGRLEVAPCMPAAWAGFEARLERPGGSLVIRVEKPEGLSEGAARLSVDGRPCAGRAIDFPEDGKTVEVLVWIVPMPDAEAG